MLAWIRKFSIRKAGICSAAMTLWEEKNGHNFEFYSCCRKCTFALYSHSHILLGSSRLGSGGSGHSRRDAEKAWQARRLINMNRYQLRPVIAISAGNNKI